MIDFLLASIKIYGYYFAGAFAVGCLLAWRVAYRFKTESK